MLCKSPHSKLRADSTQGKWRGSPARIRALSSPTTSEQRTLLQKRCRRLIGSHTRLCVSLNTARTCRLIAPSTYRGTTDSRSAAAGYKLFTIPKSPLGHIASRPTNDRRGHLAMTDLTSLSGQGAADRVLNNRTTPTTRQIHPTIPTKRARTCTISCGLVTGAVVKGPKGGGHSGENRSDSRAIVPPTATGFCGEENADRSTRVTR